MNAPLPFTRIERALGRIVWPRMSVWLYLSIALLVLVWWFAAPMLKVILYKAVILTLMAFLGDKIARAMEGKGPRPHELVEQAEAMRKQHTDVFGSSGPHPPTFENLLAQEYMRRADAVLYRRAVIIATAMVAGALGT